jgi:hypothetical protein
MGLRRNSSFRSQSFFILSITFSSCLEVNPAITLLSLSRLSLLWVTWLVPLARVEEDDLEEVARAGMAEYTCSLLLECEVGGTVSVEEVRNWDNLSPFLVLGPMVSYMFSGSGGAGCLLPPLLG